MVCPEVAYVANPNKKTSPTGRAEVGRCCAVGVLLVLVPGLAQLGGI